MKILYITTSTELGGAEKVLADLAVACSQKNTVRVLSLRPCGKVAELLVQHGVEVSSLNIVKKTWPGKLIKQIQKQLEDFNPDIVHAFLYWGIELARIACSGKRVKLISSPHFDFSKRPFYQRVIDFLLKNRDQLTIAESFSTAQYLIKNQKYAKEKVYLLPNSVDSKVYFRDLSLRAAMRKKYGYTDDNIVILQVSRLEPVKNPTLLLLAFRNLERLYPQVRLVFVGGGSEQETLKNHIQELNLKDKVLLAGWQQEVNPWLNMADIFVLPSNEESSPLALLEALQVGLPCVVSKVGDMPLWVEHGKNGFVFPPQDIALLSCFLTELCTQTELRLKQGIFSLEKMQSFQHSFPLYQQIYEQVFNGEFSRENNCRLGKG